MSIRLRDLIRAVRACKTAAEERSVIAKESAALRNAFRDQDTLYRHRNVAKLMFIHMLGYPTHFGQMECLKCIAATGFPEKRIGYLGLMILLDERHEVLMLVTNSLKNDLNAASQYSVGLALCALGNICSVEMARDLAPELERLLGSANSYVRKKAALCCTRVLRKVPEAIEGFQERAASLLRDRHHGVLLAGVTLLLELCAIQPALIHVYQELVPQLVKILRSLLMSGFAPEHDVAGITDPFLQVKVLQLLRVLGHGSSEVSDQMGDVLAQVATNTEAARNAGNAILYEAVQTIMATESLGGLRVLAVNILGRFLAVKDNNIRYVALNTLARVVAVDTQAVQRHRATIVECVKDADVSIRRRALDLVYALVNEGNIRQLTGELLDYLAVADADFRPDLAAKICQLAQRFAPDKRWHFDSVLRALEVAGAHAKEEVCRTLVVLVSNEPPLHAYAARQSARALRAAGGGGSLLLLTTAAWFVGEFGDRAAAPGAALLEGEAPLGLDAGGLVALLAGVAGGAGAPPAAVEYALTALMKLSSRLPGQAAAIQRLVGQHVGSRELETQARSCEFGRLFRFERLRPQLLEPMPALDEATYLARFNAPAVVATGPTFTGAAEAAVGANGTLAADLGDLLSLDDEAPAPTTAAAPLGAAAPDYLADLLGGGGGGAPPLAPTGAAPAAAPRQAAPAPAADLMDLLGGGGGGAAPPAQAAAPPAPPPASWPTVTVFEKDGVSVAFDFRKPEGRPGATDIQATCRATGGSSVTGFSLQAAVPKFMQLKLDPASGSSLAPGGPPVTQALHVANSQHGAKPLALRLRLSYTLDGAQRTEQVEVKNLPRGL